MFAEFINTYGMELLQMIAVAIFGFLGTVAKNLVTKYLNDKTKQSIARVVVQGVEQIYKDLHGEDKLNAALTTFSEMLAEKGITVTDLEMRMLIEAAVGEFNNVFNKGEAIEEPTEGSTTDVPAEEKLE